MNTLQSSKSYMGSSVARAGNYDDYQSYVEDHTQYNKEVRSFCLLKYKFPTKAKTEKLFSIARAFW